MKLLLLALAFVCVTLASSEESWIVVLHPNITESIRLSHLNRYAQHIVANYSLGDFKGYSAHLTEQQLIAEMATGHVKYIEREQIMHASQTCKIENNAVWGLDRISEVEIELDGQYHYEQEGSGVVAYIVDTGILTTHTEFSGGRASWGANFVNDGRNTDCNGHGTHVAGTVGGTLYGVAKKVTVVAVKVLGCTGSGTTTGVIAGIQWAANNRNGRPGVANMSLGGGKSQATNDAVAAAVKSGLTFAVAAGNENQDACNVSPASEPSAITAGATTVSDQGQDSQFDSRSTFSNFGKCVKILAPGSLIKSAWYTSNTATNTISGTSMASPHVCGAAALVLGANPSYTPAQVQQALVDGATNGVIDLLCTSTACRSTPNKLLFSGCS